MRIVLFTFVVASVGIAALAWSTAVQGPVPTTLEDFFLPGSQPGESGTINNPTDCDNCHANYNIDIEPYFNWQGSMMAQALRDPLFTATRTVAEQDAPNSGDMCLRCHTPKGWLENRSVPTDGSALISDDYEGISCDFCHRMVTPTPLGTNPYPADPDYTSGTLAEDQAYLATIDSIPMFNANGMYLVASNQTRRGPFTDANASHQILYSPFFSSAQKCGTCHDVSNPVFSRVSGPEYVPNNFNQRAPDFSPYAMFPVERTYSEWLMSDYNTPGGVFAPEFGGNKTNVSTCQDCHMRDVSGKGCDKQQAVDRDDQPLHDLTGGNTFVPELLKTQFPGEVNAAALDSGVVRARRMLQLAATISTDWHAEETGYEVDITITNQTGHKLPSGYPEGRRIWLNVQGYDGQDNLVYESGAYNPTTGVLTHDADVKIYQIKPGVSYRLSPVVGVSPGPSFHFVLNDTIWSDNRIPPRGFTNANYEQIQSPPVDYSYDDGEYWDETDYLVPFATQRVEVTLYYQTTSKEYVEFLRDANMTDQTGQTMYDLWDTHGKSPPEAMVHDTINLPGPVSVDPRVPGELRLVGAVPNPSSEGLVIWFSLPDGSPAQLELYDVRGRRVISLGVGAWGAGSHRVDLAQVKPIEPGVYFARLRKGGKSLSTKVHYQP